MPRYRKENKKALEKKEANEKPVDVVTLVECENTVLLRKNANSVEYYQGSRIRDSLVLLDKCCCPESLGRSRRE